MTRVYIFLKFHTLYLFMGKDNFIRLGAKSTLDSVSDDAIEVPWPGGSGETDVVRISPVSGTGNRLLTVTSSENVYSERSVTVRVSTPGDGSVYDTFTITQAGASFSLSESSLSWSWQGGSSTITVDTTVLSGRLSTQITGPGADRFSASLSGYTITVTCADDYRSTTDDADAVLTVFAGNLDPQTVTLTQKVSPRSYSYGSWALVCSVGGSGSTSYMFPAGGSESGVLVSVESCSREVSVVYDNPNIPVEKFTQNLSDVESGNFVLSVGSGSDVFGLSGTSIPYTGGSLTVTCATAGTKVQGVVDGTIVISGPGGPISLAVSRSANAEESAVLNITPLSVDVIPAGPGAQSVNITVEALYTYTSKDTAVLYKGLSYYVSGAGDISEISDGSYVLSIPDRGTVPGSARTTRVRFTASAFGNMTQPVEATATYTQEANEVVSGDLVVDGSDVLDVPAGPDVYTGRFTYTPYSVYTSGSRGVSSATVQVGVKFNPSTSDIWWASLDQSHNADGGTDCTVSIQPRGVVVGDVRSVSYTMSVVIGSSSLSKVITFSQVANAVESSDYRVSTFSLSSGGDESTPVPASGGTSTVSIEAFMDTTYTSTSVDSVAVSPDISCASEWVTVESLDGGIVCVVASRGSILGDIRTAPVVASVAGVSIGTISLYQAANVISRYDTPDITLAYSPLPSAGGTVYPVLSYSVVGYYSSGVSFTVTEGANVVFAIDGNSFEIDSATGALTASNANESGSTIHDTVSCTVSGGSDPYYSGSVRVLVSQPAKQKDVITLTTSCIWVGDYTFGVHVSASSVVQDPDSLSIVVEVMEVGTGVGQPFTVTILPGASVSEYFEWRSNQLHPEAAAVITSVNDVSGGTYETANAIYEWDPTIPMKVALVD